MDIPFFVFLAFALLAAEAIRQSDRLRKRIDGLELQVKAASRKHAALREQVDAALSGGHLAMGAEAEEGAPSEPEPSGAETGESLDQAASPAASASEELAQGSTSPAQPSPLGPDRPESPPLQGDELPGPIERNRPAKREEGTGSGAESWERWLGVRGAALVGGIALVFAGIFFVQVAIQRGWLNPAIRDAIAVVAGIVGLTRHAPLIRRGNRILGESISGAGTVLILGGAWAAAQLHDLIPHSLALLIMGGGVGVALLMAVRSNSKVLTGFALIGGYATPLLLDTAATSTFPLLGFLLVLNLGLLAALRVTRWSWLGLGAAAGTFLVQLLWLTFNEAPGGPWSVALSLGVFPLLFSAVMRRQGEGGSDFPPATLVALLAPALITLLTTPAVTSTTSLWPVTALMVALIVAARFIVRSEPLTLATSITSGLTLTVMALRTRFALKAEVTDWTWTQWAIGMHVIAFGLLILALRARPDRRPATSRAPWAVACIALFASPILGSLPERLELTGPFTVGVLSTALIAGTSALLRGSIGYTLTAGTLTGLAAGFLSFCLGAPYLLPNSPPLLAAVAVAAASLLLGRVLPTRRAAANALAASIPLVPLAILALTGSSYSSPATGAALVVVSALGLATSRKSTWTFVVAALVAAGAALDLHGHLGLSDRWEGSSMLLPLASFCLIVSALPLAALWQREAEGPQGELFALITVAPALVLALAASSSSLLTEASGLALLGLDGRHVVLFSAAAVLHLARRIAHDGPTRPRACAIVDAATVTMAWCGLAQLVSFDWPTISLAGAAAAFAFFPGRAQSQNVTTIAGTVLGAAGLGLIFSTYVLNSFSSEALLIPLDVTVDHALVAMALLAGLMGLGASNRGGEIKSVRVGIAAVLLGVTFSWINAVILNYFSTGEIITLDVERMQSRDLAMSFAWTAFAVVLLVAGVRRSVSGLRWASLVVLVATVLKVFLYDLEALEGLARVGSFLGLAICLLGVSLLYGKVLGQDSGRDGAGGDNLLPHDDDPQPDA